MPQSKPNINPLVWVTRPRGLEGELIDGLQGAGFSVHYEAMLEIQPLSAVGQTYPEQLARLVDQDAVIFISANAVYSFIKLATRSQQAALKNLAVYAVGTATAACLAGIGVEAIHPKKLMSSEGLLTLKSLQNMVGKQVFIVRGYGGRGFLQQQLQARGASAEHVELYLRVAPAQVSVAVQQAAAEQRFCAVFVGSVETFENVLGLVPTLARNTIIITPSRRVSKYVRSTGFVRVAEAASASNADMIKILQDTLAS